jgi:hypothetical protein
MTLQMHVETVDTSARHCGDVIRLIAARLDPTHKYATREVRCIDPWCTRAQSFDTGIQAMMRLRDVCTARRIGGARMERRRSE